jgi:hypothetical protein
LLLISFLHPLSEAERKMPCVSVPIDFEKKKERGIFMDWIGFIAELMLETLPLFCVLLREKIYIEN